MSMRPASDFQPMIERLGGASPPSWLTPESTTLLRTVEQLPFSLAEYTARRRRVLDRVSELGADAIVVFRPSSVEYLCGHHTVETIPQPLVLTESETFLYVPDAEVGRALASSCAETVLHYANTDDGLALVAQHLSNLLPPNGRVAIELRHNSVSPRAMKLLRSNHLKLVDSNFLIEEVRLVLSPTEIGYVERAAVSTQRGVEAAVQAAREPGATDSSVAAAITAALFEDTDSAAALQTIVATGRRSGIPHSTWNRTPLADTTFLEFAGAHHRYCAPVMRTLARGPLTDPVMRLADLAQRHLAAVLDSARPGVSCSEVAHRAMEVIGRLEDSIIFHYNFGYPVGLAHPPTWMDGAPFYLTTENHASLRKGMVFHLPASFRSFGNVGVGLSHTIVIEDTGARPLTHNAAEVIHV